MDYHLVYEKIEHTDSMGEIRDYRNGYMTKQVNSSFGNMYIAPQDCLCQFEPQVEKNAKKIFLILIEILFLCIQRG